MHSYHPHYQQYPHYPPQGYQQDIERKVRDAMHGQQQPQFQQQYQQPPQSGPGITCRFVGGIEEARAATIDPLTTSVFVDVANSKVYIKKIDNNGVSAMQSFGLETDKPVEKPADYAEKIAALEKRVADLEKPGAEKHKEPKEGGSK